MQDRQDCNPRNARLVFAFGLPIFLFLVSVASMLLMLALGAAANPFLWLTSFFVASSVCLLFLRTVLGSIVYVTKKAKLDARDDSPGSTTGSLSIDFPWTFAIVSATIGAILCVITLGVGRQEYIATAWIESLPAKNGVYDTESLMSPRERIGSIRNPNLLQQLLSIPRIGGMQELEAAADPVRYLQDRLGVDSIDGSDDVRVTFRAENEDTAKEVLGLAISLLLDEIEAEHRRVADEKYEQLSAAHENLEEQIRKRQRSIAEFLERFSPTVSRTEASLIPKIQSDSAITKQDSIIDLSIRHSSRELAATESLLEEIGNEMARASLFPQATDRYRVASPVQVQEVARQPVDVLIFSMTTAVLIFMFVSVFWGCCRYAQWKSLRSIDVPTSVG